MTAALRAVADGWASWCVEMAWQVTVVVLVVALLERVVRRASPSLRHALWSLVFVKLVLPPDLVSPWRSAVAGAVDGVGGDGGGLVPVVFLLWLIVVVALGLARARAGRRARVLWIRGAELPDRALEAQLEHAVARLGLRHAPTLRLTPHVPTPLTLGLRRPLVLLPAAWARIASTHDLEHVLLHECAHLKRGDLWLARLFGWLQLAYAWHPFVSWATVRAQRAREACCDATVVAALGGHAAGYRATLLRQARGALEDPPPAVASCFLGGADGIVARLVALERPLAPRPLRAAALLAVLGPVLLPLGAAVLAPIDDAVASRARAALTHLLPHRPGDGCLPLRFAVMGAAASLPDPPASPSPDPPR